MSIDPVSVLAPGPAGAADLAPRPATASPSPPATESVVPQSRATQVSATYQDNLIIYRILDKETGDLILQIPPEQLLEIARSVRQLLETTANKPGVDVTS